MITGLGMDIVKTQRIARLVEKYGRDFLTKVFAEDELESFGEETGETGGCGVAVRR